MRALLLSLGFLAGLSSAEGTVTSLGSVAPRLRENPHFQVLEKCLTARTKWAFAESRELAAKALSPALVKAADEQSLGLIDLSDADRPTATMNAAALLLWFEGDGHFQQGDYPSAKPLLETVWRKYPLARARLPDDTTWFPASDAYVQWLTIGYWEAIKEGKMDTYPFARGLSPFHGAPFMGSSPVSPLTTAARTIFKTEGPGPLEVAMAQMLASDDFKSLEHSEAIARLLSALTSPPHTGKESDWTAWQGQLEKWLADSPDSQLAKLALVGFWIEYAWRARGGGSAANVSEERAKLFRDRLMIALELQSRHAVRHPMWHVHGLILARGLNAIRSVRQSLYAEGVKHFPWFSGIHEQMLIALLPRWGGRQGDWENFALQAARDSGPEVYLELCRVAESYEGTESLANNPLVEWKLIWQGYESRLRRNRDAWSLANHYARRAVLRGDRAAAAAAFSHRAARFNPLYWDGLAEYKHSKDWAFTNPFERLTASASTE
jgi:hypothetical protein